MKFEKTPSLLIKTYMSGEDDFLKNLGSEAVSALKRYQKICGSKAVSALKRYQKICGSKAVSALKRYYDNKKLRSSSVNFGGRPLFS